VDDCPLSRLEDAGAVSGPALPRHHLRWARQCRSTRPDDSAQYADWEITADALAVLDATQTPKAAIVALSRGARWATLLAAEHPDRVSAAVFVAPAMTIGDVKFNRDIYPFRAVLDTEEGWAKFNEHFWRKDYPAFTGFFPTKIFTEPHSTKAIEDFTGWMGETTGEVAIATFTSPNRTNGNDLPELIRQIRCPVLVIHGDEDEVVPYDTGANLAELTGGRLFTIVGGGHAPTVRDPVQVNLRLREFIQPAPPRTLTWTRGRSREKRALYISSPIGLGHAQRDVAIASELRKLHPDLRIDWLAQNPVTRVLEARGERIHPASALLANESQHIESESAEHDLHRSSPATASAPRRSAAWTRFCAPTTCSSTMS
jgi:pimeloyl-ACP methyl ester carboxylesterase